MSAAPFGRRFLTLGAGEATARVVAFGGAVYLARTLGPQTYGAVILATTIVLYGSRISDAGVDLLGVADVARERERLGELLADRLGARFSVALVLAGALAIAGMAWMPQPEGSVLALYGLTLLPMSLGSAWALLGLQRSDHVAGARMATEALAVALVLVLVHQPGDVGRAPVAQFVGEGAGALLLLRALPRDRLRLRPFLGPRGVVSLYRRSWPLVLHALLGLMIFNVDFLFLRVLRDSATLGWYAASFALVSFCLNVGRTHSLSMLPLMTAAREEPARERALYQAAMAQVLAGTLPIALGGTLVAGPLIVAVFGQEYAPAVLPLQILCWTIPISLFRGMAQNVLIAHGRQALLLTGTIWAVVVNLSLNVILIPAWGMTGAAVATIASVAVRLAYLLYSIRPHGLGLLPVTRVLRPLAGAAAMAAIVVLTRGAAVWIPVTLGAVTYSGALAALGVLRFRRGALPELRL